MLALIGLQQHNLIGGMRRQHRQLLALARDRLGFGARDLIARHHARRRNPIEHAIARGPRGIRKTVGPAQFRRLRQRDQQRGFGQR